MSLFRGTRTTTSSTRIEAFQSTTCEYSPIRLQYGTSKISPNLICYQDFETQTKSVTVKSGKSKSTTISYLYWVYVQMALCEGVIDGVNAIWVGDKKYASLGALNSNSSNVGGALNLNLGNDSSPTAYMQTRHPSIAVGYDNLAYLHGKIFLGEDSASMPSYSVEVKKASLSNGDGTDVNVAYVIKDILTKIGLSSAIDENSYDNYYNYCQSADWLVSTPADEFTSQKKAQEIIEKLLELTNTYMVFSVDKYKFIPRDDQSHGSWNPNTTVVYDLNSNDMIQQNSGGCISFKRKDTSEIYNYITIDFTNRANDYESESLSYQSLESINKYGLRNVTYDAKWYHNKARALKYAKMKARMAQTEMTQYQFQLPQNYSRLEAGDLLRLTDDTIGLSNQIVMVSEVAESSDGILSVTAIQRAGGNYSEAQYSVDDNYQYQNFNVEPSDTDNPLFIIPPSDLITSANGLEVWIAMHGKDNTWGGCDVYLSDKDGGYSYHGTQGMNSLYGVIIGSITASSTVVNIRLSNPTNEELMTGSVADAEAGNTLIWVNGECMSYSNATLTAKNTWSLSGLVRGQYGTVAKAHNSGEDMAMLNGAIYVVPLTKHYQGKTLYFKFPSFNVFKGNNQSINDLDYYTVIANVADLPNVSNLTAFNRYRECADDVTRYDIVVEWEPPSFDSYQQAQLWYKTSSVQASNLGVISEGALGKDLGFSGKWVYGGQGYDSAIIPQAVIGDTYKIAVCTQDIYGNIESPDMSTQTTITVAMKTEIPNTPEGFSIQYGESIHVYWKEVRNADIKYYELRNDLSVLLRTNSLECYPALTSRSGKLYLYAVSAYGVYSAPATLEYSKEKPLAPTAPIARVKMEGLDISMDAIPNDCYKIKLEVNSDQVELASNRYFYPCSAGVYTVKYCFVDYFGDGDFSAISVVTIDATIPPEMIKADSITYDKMAPQAKQAIADASVSNINIAVSGLLGSGSALVMDEGSYALVASNGEKLTGIFTNEAGTMRLQGDYIHITGDTVFDSDAIIKGQMKAGSISCDDGVSIYAGALSITGDGMFFNNGDGETFGCVARQMIGQARNGQHISFTTQWDNIPSVIVVPMQWQSQSTTYPNTNLSTECYAKNITKNGFDVVCKTMVGAGSYGQLSYVSTNDRRWITSTTTINSNSVTVPASASTTVVISGSITMQSAFQIPEGSSGSIGWSSCVATLYIDGSAVQSKDLGSGYNVYTPRELSVSFTASIANSASVYISYTIIPQNYTFVFDGVSYTYGCYATVNGGSCTYTLNTAITVADGSVTFLVMDKENRYYTVS